MYRAITVKHNGIISGVHDSAVPFVTNHFARNPELVDDTVVLISESGEYRTGLHVLCYNEDGTQKPDVWCIENGYMELPPNKEIINGELVDKEIPAEEQPQTLKQYLEEQFGAVRQETAPAQKAATVMFRALAQTDVIAPTDALDNAGMFPLWADCIGKRAEAGSYWRHGDSLYRVNAGQGHAIQADWPPDQAASLFSLAANPADEWPEWIQPTGAHNAYAMGAKVTYQGDRWILDAETSAYAPGVVPGQWIKQS